MGKVSAFKKIRKIAAGLPDITGQKMQGFKILGADLIKLFGISEIKGEPVNPELRYYLPKERIPVTYQINHEQKMKDLYMKFGIKAAEDYAKLVQLAYMVHIGKVALAEQEQAELLNPENAEV